MGMVIVSVSLDGLTEFLALAVLHPCSKSCGFAWANSLHAKCSFKALLHLTLTIHHELFRCNCQVAKRDDAVTKIVAAVAFAMGVAAVVAMAMAMVITVAFIIVAMDNGRRFDQIPLELRCAPILVFIRILLAVNDDVAVQDLLLDIDVQLVLTVFSPVDNDRLTFLINGPVRITWNGGAHEVIVTISSELNREATIWALELPLCAITVSKEQLLDRGQSSKVKSFSPILRVWNSMALQVFSLIDRENISSEFFPVDEKLTIKNVPSRIDLVLCTVEVASWPEANLHLSLGPIHVVPADDICLRRANHLLLVISTHGC
mmetsp:Transcript_88343/g.156656  ORF Transcript_88343/g.156656 Transcript_88343/m.156656 type:complete len:318 (+) Transcript_88343:582-1535(+)